MRTAPDSSEFRVTLNSLTDAATKSALAKVKHKKKNGRRRGKKKEKKRKERNEKKKTSYYIHSLTRQAQVRCRRAVGDYLQVPRKLVMYPTT